MQRISPLSALFQLLCFSRGLVGMTQEHFDDCFDAVTALLEKANDNSYRLVQESSQEEAQDASGDSE